MCICGTADRNKKRRKKRDRVNTLSIQIQNEDLILLSYEEEELPKDTQTEPYEEEKKLT